MRVICILTLSTIFFLNSLTISNAETKPVGIVKSIENSVSIRREGKILTVEDGMAVWMGAEISTDSTGSWILSVQKNCGNSEPPA